MTNGIADNFLHHPYVGMTKAIMPSLECIEILKITLFATGILARYCCYKIVLIGNIVDEVFYFLNNVRSFKNCKLKQILWTPLP